MIPIIVMKIKLSIGLLHLVWFMFTLFDLYNKYNNKNKIVTPPPTTTKEMPPKGKPVKGYPPTDRRTRADTQTPARPPQHSTSLSSLSSSYSRLDDDDEDEDAEIDPEVEEGERKVAVDEGDEVEETTPNPPRLQTQADIQNENLSSLVGKTEVFAGFNREKRSRSRSIDTAPELSREDVDVKPSSYKRSRTPVRDKRDNRDKAMPPKPKPKPEPKTMLSVNKDGAYITVPKPEPSGQSSSNYKIEGKESKERKDGGDDDDTETVSYGSDQQRDDDNVTVPYGPDQLRDDDEVTVPFESKQPLDDSIYAKPEPRDQLRNNNDAAAQLLSPGNFRSRPIDLRSPPTLTTLPPPPPPGLTTTVLVDQQIRYELLQKKLDDLTTVYRKYELDANEKFDTLTTQYNLMKSERDLWKRDYKTREAGIELEKLEEKRQITNGLRPDPDATQKELVRLKIERDDLKITNQRTEAALKTANETGERWQRQFKIMETWYLAAVPILQMLKKTTTQPVTLVDQKDFRPDQLTIAALNSFYEGVWKHVVDGIRENLTKEQARTQSQADEIKKWKEAATELSTEKTEVGATLERMQGATKQHLRDMFGDNPRVFGTQASLATKLLGLSSESSNTDIDDTTVWTRAKAEVHLLTNLSNNVIRFMKFIGSMTSEEAKTMDDIFDIVARHTCKQWYNFMNTIPDLTKFDIDHEKKPWDVNMKFAFSKITDHIVWVKQTATATERAKWTAHIHIKDSNELQDWIQEQTKMANRAAKEKLADNHRDEIEQLVREHKQELIKMKEETERNEKKIADAREKDGQSGFESQRVELTAQKDHIQRKLDASNQVISGIGAVLIKVNSLLGVFSSELKNTISIEIKFDPLTTSTREFKSDHEQVVREAFMNIRKQSADRDGAIEILKLIDAKHRDRLAKLIPNEAKQVKLAEDEKYSEVMDPAVDTLSKKIAIYVVLRGFYISMKAEYGSNEVTEPEAMSDSAFGLVVNSLIAKIKASRITEEKKQGAGEAVDRNETNKRVYSTEHWMVLTAATADPVWAMALRGFMGLEVNKAVDRYMLKHYVNLPDALCGVMIENKTSSPIQIKASIETFAWAFQLFQQQSLMAPPKMPNINAAPKNALRLFEELYKAILSVGNNITSFRQSGDIVWYDRGTTSLAGIQKWCGLLYSDSLSPQCNIARLYRAEIYNRVSDPKALTYLTTEILK